MHFQMTVCARVSFIVAHVLYVTLNPCLGFSGAFDVATNVPSVLRTISQNIDPESFLEGRSLPLTPHNLIIFGYNRSQLPQDRFIRFVATGLASFTALSTPIPLSCTIPYQECPQKLIDVYRPLSTIVAEVSSSLHLGSRSFVHISPASCGCPCRW